MSGYETDAPELVPVLSRGKHRNPRRGACFMEFASYLAGEPWSDHPACTHPLLAALARDVNDYTSDAARGRLAELIPSVIGLTGDDLHIDARIALVCARMALPVVAAARQQVLAVSVLVCERVLADLDGQPAGPRWRRFRTRSSGPAASVAISRSPRRPSAGALRRSPSTPRRMESRMRASRSPTGCFMTCLSALSANAPRGPPLAPGAAFRRRQSLRRRQSPASAGKSRPHETGPASPKPEPACRYHACHENAAGAVAAPVAGWRCGRAGMSIQAQTPASAITRAE